MTDPDTAGPEPADTPSFSDALRRVADALDAAGRDASSVTRDPDTGHINIQLLPQEAS